MSTRANYQIALSSAAATNPLSAAPPPLGAIPSIFSGGAEARRSKSSPLLRPLPSTGSAAARSGDLHPGRFGDSSFGSVQPGMQTYLSG
uniref:Uncharacterized protein n=1 Tax=Oryza meridionalis TaxID=40149 RepID=A0A0E0ESZ5_9ORYZ